MWVVARQRRPYWQGDAPWQQLAHAIDRPVGDNRQHVTKIMLRIDAVQATAPDQPLQLPEHHKKHWKPLITSMTNWEKEIFAYFGPAQRKTNAFTESNNRKIRDLNRDPRGMSFEMFRAKTLFTLKHKFSKPKPVKESPFTVLVGSG